MAYPPNQHPPQELFQPELRPVFVTTLEHRLAHLRTEAWETVPQHGINPLRKHLYATTILLDAANAEGRQPEYTGGRTHNRYFESSDLIESYEELDEQLRGKEPDTQRSIILANLEPVRKSILYPEILVVRLLATNIRNGRWNDRSGNPGEMLYKVIPHTLAVQGLTAIKQLRETPSIPSQRIASPRIALHKTTTPM